MKLFVSHSSRLDDVPHKWTSADRNWRLLDDTCKAIKAHYGHRIEILVDKDGLVPGDQWNHRLNLWLAECHAAIILVSKRALEKSDWVAKEAAILSWRAEIDPDFALIPVTLQGETTAGDLANGFGGSIRLDDSQCIRDACSGADVLAGLRRLGWEPDALPHTHETPLDLLRAGIAELLADRATPASIEAALGRLGAPTTPTGAPRHERRADQLARRLLDLRADAPGSCFDDFRTVLQDLAPDPALGDRDIVQLFKAIRALWVMPAAASHLPRALREGHPIALAATQAHLADPELGTEHYTLDRYIERAWLRKPAFRVIPVTGVGDVDQVRQQIRAAYFPPPAFRVLRPDVMDEHLRADPNCYPILTIATGKDGRPPPDRAQLQDLVVLRQEYPQLVVLLTMEPDHDPLSNKRVSIVEPALDPDAELRAYSGESRTCMDLKLAYGRCT
jgi:hypothetical protein